MLPASETGSRAWLMEPALLPVIVELELREEMSFSSRAVPPVQAKKMDSKTGAIANSKHAPACSTVSTANVAVFHTIRSPIAFELQEKPRCIYHWWSQSVRIDC